MGVPVHTVDCSVEWSVRMALPKEMELLDLDQFEANKTVKSPSRKFAKKKQGGSEVSLMSFCKLASTVVWRSPDPFPAIIGAG